MIPFEFEYVRPTRAEDAASLFREATDMGKTVRYLSGGTELVTMARDGKLTYDVLIDLKRIPETTILDNSSLSYGACVRLSALRDGGPKKGSTALVGLAAGGVADRTTRNSITLGGNICGMLPYREALLPFLLLDGEITVVGEAGRRRVGVATLFERRLKLQPGEFVLTLHLNEKWNDAQGYYDRKTREPRVDYPLVTMCMARDEGGYRLAVAGAFGSPVRDLSVEAILNGGGSAPETEGVETESIRAAAVSAFGSECHSDLRGSSEYRATLLRQCIGEGLIALGGSR